MFYNLGDFSKARQGADCTSSPPFSVRLSAVKTAGSHAVDLVERKMLESFLTGTGSA